MYNKVKTLIAACLYYSGWVALGRWWIRRQGPRLIILTYHTATPGNLRQHWLYLRRHYRLLHLEDALEELFSPSSHKVQDRRTPLAITFDDGYYDNYTHSFPLACELQIPITIFLVPGYIKTGDHYWWHEPDYLVAHAKVHEVTVEGQKYHLNKSQEREALRQAIDARVRFASSVHERETYLEEVRQLLMVPYAATLEEKNELPMSWVEIDAMKKCKWISFGGHTMHHPILTYLTDPSEVEYEVRECRIELEHHLQSPVRSFAYPVGKFGEQAIRSVQKAGYFWALTTVKGLNTPQTNPYLLHRLSIEPWQHWLLIAVRVSDMRHFFTNFLGAPIKFLLRLAK